MVTREDFEWWEANYRAKLAEAAEQEDDNGEALARWANEGGSLIQYDNEAYRRDFPEVTDEDE